MHEVYVTHNKVNGRKYIGSHNKSNKKYLGSGTYISKAIQKYGRKSFEKEILAECNTAEERRDLEEYFIDYYNAYKSPLFYNATKYAAGVTKVSKNHKKKISKANKGHTYNKGRVWSEESKAKVSKANKGKKIFTAEQKEAISKRMKGRISPMLGRKMSAESKAKISASKKGHKCYSNPERGKKISKNTLGKKKNRK